MILKILSQLFLTILTIAIVTKADAKIIKTTGGPIRGLLRQWGSLNYYSYMGIPYAESPTGSLRFMPPVPIKPWTRILDATREKHLCPQESGKYEREKMNEDCLFINIHVPVNVNQNVHKLPVLVFVHGGAFRLHSGNSDVLYGPQLFIQHGVIFVSMNFRLGALGFLSLDIDEASGNAAIKDILLALKWVKENIERFGGDPNKITLGGHSSGAAIIHCLAVSKHSINLFNQVILISGNADNPRSLSRHAKENALTLAKELGLPINDVNILLNKLREINVFDIIDAETNLTKYDEVILRPFSMFTPTAEIESSHAVITSEPRELELLQNIKILTGFNYREGIFLIPKINNTAKLKKLNKEMELAIPSNIEYPLKSKISLDLAKSIGEKYFNTNLSNFTLNNIIDLASDSQYIYGIDSWVKKLKQMNNSNDLYYYIFDFDGGLNWAKLYYKIDFPGTAHADELGYVFVTRNTAPLLNHVDHKSNLVMNMLLTLFSNFIKYGNPTPAGFTSDFKWEKYNKDGTLLYIREKPVKGTLSNQLVDRLKFWDDVYEKYYNYIKSGGKLEKKCIP